MSNLIRPRNGMRRGTYAITGDYLATSYARSAQSRSNSSGVVAKQELLPLDFNFRNASVRFRDRHSDLGERVDIRVEEWSQKDVDGDPVYSDWIVIHAPETTMYHGIITLKGFVHVYKRNGDRLSEILNGDDTPMKRAELTMRSESDLNDDGLWLGNINPDLRAVKKKKT